MNYSFDSMSFKVPVQTTSTRKKGRVQKWPESVADLDKCYDTKIPISLQKKNDLVGLCTKDIIPEEFHGYFTSLAVSKAKKDTVPVLSSDEDTDAE